MASVKFLERQLALENVSITMSPLVDFIPSPLGILPIIHSDGTNRNNVIKHKHVQEIIMAVGLY